MTEERTEPDLEAIDDLLSAIPDDFIAGTNDEKVHVALVALYVQAPRLLADLVAEIRRLQSLLVVEQRGKWYAEQDLSHWRDETADLLAEIRRWRAWERAWIFGVEAEWPGSQGTTDPREELAEVLADLERLSIQVAQLME